MIDTATTERIRLLVGDIHDRNEMVHIYRVAREIPTLDGGHDMAELTDAIAKEAMRIKAAMSWHRMTSESQMVTTMPASSPCKVERLRALLSQNWFALTLEQICVWAIGGALIFFFFY